MDLVSHGNLLAALLLGGMVLIAGCSGSDGKDGEPGAPASVDIANALEINASIEGVTIASPPVVDFTLTDALVQEGIEVVLDDRDERPGVKFKDADLVGIPYRVTVGPKGLAEGRVELVRRKTRQARPVELQKAAGTVSEAILEERSFSSQI